MFGVGMHHYHHQPWPPAFGHPPPSIAAPPPPPPHTRPPPIPLDSPSSRSLSDEVQTVFIFGLPEDRKERELQNLMRWLSGYEASQVNFIGEHPMGFAFFATGHHALAAKDALQDMVFDARSKFVGTGGDYMHTTYST